MDYVVGSVAALITGNVTPNRPKLSKKAFTPIKQQPSPNVTPKSELVEDRSIFLSPTMQKKKAIVKKSPKRIFQNQELDVAIEEDPKSPKADKVKKHLKNQLDGSTTADQILLSLKSPEKKAENTIEKISKKKLKLNRNEILQMTDEKSSKKKKRKSMCKSEDTVFVKNNSVNDNDNEKENISSSEIVQNISKRKQLKSESEIEVDKSNELLNLKSVDNKKSKKKKMTKRQQNDNIGTQCINPKPEITKSLIKNKDSKTKTKKNQKSKKKLIENDIHLTNSETINTSENIKVNPNAIINNDTDSDHSSDDEIVSENEEINKKALDTGLAEESSDEEPEKLTKEKEDFEKTPPTDDVIKRTLFIGNVPFSSKCKKEIKKIFSQYGQINTVRIRTVPVKDARVTPKMAIIKKELHPNRTTVNVYIKYTDAASIDKALAANNTMLNGYHLRVSRSGTTGQVHDPRNSVFVGNMPFTLEDEALRAKFEKCGEIYSVRIIRDRTTQAGKGFGYVNFKSKDGVELALAMTEEDLTIKNRILRVKRCTQTSQKKPDQGQNFGKKFQNFRNREIGNQVSQGKFPAKHNVKNNDGAYRRIAKKRINQESGDGPPNKKQNLNHPYKEKKTRKEFVGMTAEKKKKHKFNKGQKKKKALSEILTKK